MSRTYIRTIFAIVGAALLPAIVTNAAPIIPQQSDFDTGADGWTLGANVSWQASGGNPNGFLFVTGGPTADSTANAPASWLGDWSFLNGNGYISFDYRIISLGGDPYAFAGYPAIFLSGPGGSATWNGEGESVTSVLPWTPFTAHLDSANWMITTGTWNDLLSDITSVGIAFSTIYNNADPQDTDGLDNVMLVPEPANVSLLVLSLLAGRRRLSAGGIR